MKIELSAEEVTLLRAALRSHHDKMWSQISELKRPHQGYDVTLFETWRKWADESLALSKRISDEADWSGAWGAFPEKNPQWRAMALITAREAVPAELDAAIAAQRKEGES